jgi:Zn-dependent protease
LRVRPAITVDQVLDLLDRHHAQVRDFHLSRRLFVPMSDTERSNTAALGVAYNEGAAGGFPYPEVLTEMERLQSKKTSWIGGLVILGISLLLFIAAGTGSGGGDDKQRFSRDLLLLLIPILLFHELGHYLAMRVFRYRNVRMFFIPFFGAAVSGTNYNAPGWKKAIVALMGPVPGIVLGGGLGIAGIVLHHDLLIKAALLLLILNGSNLLPVLPLDGGRVVQTLLFSRHYAADIIFRAAAALALIGIAAWGGGRFFLILGIAMLLGIPLAWRLGRIAAELKRSGLTPPPTNDHRIPPAVAQAIITRLKSTPAKGMGQNNKILAQHALTVYETLCTRPPGWLATAAFAVVHLGSVVIALVLAIALLMAQGGPMVNFFREAANQPRNRIASSEIVSYPATTASANQGAEHKTIVANFANVGAATNAFDAIGPKLAAGESLERFGQTLFISFPAADDSARRRWIADVEARTRDFCVNTGQFGDARLRLTCIAPTGDAARDLQEQAEEYLNIPGSLHLIPPWSPHAVQHSAEWSSYRTARRTYLRLSRAGRDAYTDPRITSLNKQSNEAFRRGDKAESDRVRAQQAKLIQDIRQQEIRRIGSATDGSVDPVVVATYLKVEETINSPNDDDDPDDAGAPRVGYDSPEYKAMGSRMGQVPLTEGKPAPDAERYSTQMGGVSRTSMLITLNFMNFNEPPDGAPALVKWLESHRCKSMKYEFRTGALSGNPFD